MHKQFVPERSRQITLSGALLACLFWLIAGTASVDVRAQASVAASASAPVSANILARQARQRTSDRIWRDDAALASGAGTELGLSSDPDVIEAGRRLYVDGMRADKQPLVGVRLDGQVRITGATAACVLCHRRSGLGAVEGTNLIAPVSGRYLFDQDRRALANMNLRTRKSFNPRHEPYSLDTLAVALRAGVHESGRALDPLMPRYELSDADVLALASYLRRLSNRWSPGVEDKKVHLATVIAPDVDADRKRIFLATLNGIVAQKNGNLIHGQRTMSSGAEMALQTDRSWDMQVWELRGAPSTWQAQLDEKYRNKPVFAVVSGLGEGNWAPVHSFCEQQRVPCWFPSVGAVPADSGAGFYSVYFTAGVGLEANVLAQHLESSSKGQTQVRRLLQVYADDGVFQTAVKQARERLAGTPVKVSDLKLGDNQTELASELAKLGTRDSVVFWLAPDRIKALEHVAPGKATPYFSGTLGDGERMALSPAWRSNARLIYPYQLPEARQRGLTVFKEWLKIRKVKLEDEVLQSEVFFALDYFNDTLVDMLDNVHRDYLLERGEIMLSLREGARSEDQARDLSLPKTNLIDKNVKPLREMQQRMIIPRNMPFAVQRTPEGGARNVEPSVPAAKGMGPLVVYNTPTGTQAGSMEATGMDGHGTIKSTDGAAVSQASGAPESTNVYPRLSLGQFQRHASKGAYIVRFQGPMGTQLVADTKWLVP